MSEKHLLRWLLVFSVTSFALVAAAAFRPRNSVLAAGPHIDLYFMSSLSYGAPAVWCTGSYNPPVHSPYRAIDVFGGDSSTCLGDASTSVRLRTWGFGGSSSHLTMMAYASGGASSSGCDTVNIGMIDVAGGLHGELRWLHMSRTIGTGTAMNVWAGPSPGQQRTSQIVGYTTVDNDGGCGWVGYHVHQGTNVDCMAVNQSMSATTIYNVWDVFRHLHAIDYAEGLPLCDG